MSRKRHACNAKCCLNSFQITMQSLENVITDDRDMGSHFLAQKFTKDSEQNMSNKFWQKTPFLVNRADWIYVLVVHFAERANAMRVSVCEIKSKRRLPGRKTS